MKRKLTETPEQRERRLRNWKHNALLGHAAMMHRNAINIAEASTVNYAAKAIAQKMAQLASELEEQLRFRVDHPLPAS